jgi:xanthine dehydrogenase molybdopterin-binding subunit B
MNKYLEKIATMSATVDGTGNTPAQASSGSTLQGTQNKNTPRQVRNKMLEAGREDEPLDPINMGSRTHYSDGYVG